MWDERAKAAIDRSRNGSTGSAIMAQLLAAANNLGQRFLAGKRIPLPEAPHLAQAKVPGQSLPAKVSRAVRFRHATGSQAPQSRAPWSPGGGLATGRLGPQQSN